MSSNSLGSPLLLVLIVILAYLVEIPTAAAWQESREFTGHWEGTMEIPGMLMNFMVDLTYEDGTWSGTMDIPMQGAKGIPLSGIKVSGADIEFALADVLGDPIWKGILEEGKIVGTLTQSGMSIPFHLGREKVTGPTRPQEPKPPFPYDEEEVTYNNDEIILTGTLTLPRQGGPYPAVLLITGSGPQDRNEEIFGHKPFLLVADYLTRAGIAVLRVDDRGVGGSTRGSRRPTSADFVQDVLAGVGFLRLRPEIDPQRVGLIGHSEGGMIAPMAAAESDEVAFIVMLAGTAVPGMDILLEQTKLITRAAGATEEQLQAQWEAQYDALLQARAGADSILVWKAVRTLIEVQTNRLPEDQRPADEVLDAQSTQETSRVLSPWFRFFLDFDPRTVLRTVHVPVLALNGELDLQVPPYQNLPEIEATLRQAGNNDVTIREFPGLNHLFQTANTGSPAEYAMIEETMSPVVLEAVRDWILERFGGQ